MRFRSVRQKATELRAKISGIWRVFFFVLAHNYLENGTNSKKKWRHVFWRHSHPLFRTQRTIKNQSSIGLTCCVYDPEDCTTVISGV